VIRQKPHSDETIMVKTPAGHYGFPKGKRKKGEKIITTALRELDEETGLLLKDIKFCIKADCGEYIKLVENKILYYLALLNCDEKAIAFDPEELAEVKWIPIKTALEMDDYHFRQGRKDILIEAYELFKTCSFTDEPEVETPKDKPGKIKVRGDKSHMNLSKKLSWILRHGAVDLGLTIETDGSILLNDIMKMDDFKNVTIKDIEDVVANNDKKRFSFSDDKRTAELRIRANQGHSHKVAENISNVELLKEITVANSLCYHGTYKKFAEEIRKTGLNRMGRKHIHLTNSPNAISGVRPNVNAFVYIDMAAAMKDGMIFYISDNEVILTEGINGNIDPKYITKITYK